MHAVNTLWKFYHFSITEILREIKFGDSRSAKSAILTHSDALNYVFLVNLAFQKLQKCIKIKIQSPKICLFADLALLESPN